MIILCVAAATAITTLLFYVKWQSSYWSRRLVDGPAPLPFFGNMLAYFQMKKHFGEVYDDIYRSHPDATYVGFYKFGMPAILVRSLDLTKQVLLDNFQSFQANDVHLEKKLDPLLLMNPFFVRGAEWKHKRGQLTPIFTASKVKSIIPLVSGICERFVGYIERKSKAGHVFEARSLSAKFTIESTASCAFGLEAQAFGNEESSFVENTKKIFEISTLQAVRLVATFFLPVISRLLKISYLPKDVDHWLRSIITQVVEQRDESEEKRFDFLQAVLDMRDRKGAAKFDESTIVGHSLSFLTDGYETSSGLMAYCFYQLAKNPDVQRTVQEEVDRVLTQKYNGEITDDCLKELNYVENVIHETLRLNTPDFSLNKLCTEDFKLPPQYAGGEGVTIPAGTPIIIPIYSIHRDPLVFADPLTFNPDRFTESGKQDRHKYSYLAFGEGPRMCPGIRFGMMQSKAAIAMVMAKYSIEVTSKTVEPLTFSKLSLMLTCEDGIWIRFVKREN